MYLPGIWLEGVSKSDSHLPLMGWKDDGGPRTMDRKGPAHRLWGFVYRFCFPTGTGGASLNLTHQTDQAGNRAAPSIARIMATGCLASDHFRPPEDTRGLRLDSVPLSLSSVSGANRPARAQAQRPDRRRDLPIDPLNSNESFCFFCFFPSCM